MTAEEQAQAVEELENRVERIRSLYEQYFMGIEKIEPLVQRKDIDRRLWILRREQIRNTGLRFKLQQVVSRYNTFGQYWQRIIREIENGTYKRDVARAAKRFGSEALTIAARRRLGTRGVAEAAAAKGATPEGDKARALPAATEDGESTSPFRRSDLPPRSVDQTIPDAAPAMSVPPPPPRAPAKPKPPPLRLDLDADDDLFAGLDMQSTAPSPLAPVQRPGGVGASSPPTPSASARLPSPTSAPRPASSTLPRPPSSSPLRPPSTEARATLAGVDEGRTTSIAPRPAASAPAPPPARPSAPQPVGRSGLAASTPFRGSSLASSGNPFAAERPPPPKASAPPPARPAPARPSPRDPDELPETRVRELFTKYVDAKKQCNESTATITNDSLARSLRESAAKLRQKHGKQVDFDVVIKDGKAVLKPVLKG